MNEIDKLNAITQTLQIARKLSLEWPTRRRYLEMLKPKNKLYVWYTPHESNKHRVIVHMTAVTPNKQIYKLSIDTFI